MTNWLVQLANTEEQLQKVLSECSLEGWELYQLFENGSAWTVVFYKELPKVATTPVDKAVWLLSWYREDGVYGTEIRIDKPEPEMKEWTLVCKLPGRRVYQSKTGSLLVAED